MPAPRRALHRDRRGRTDRRARWVGVLALALLAACGKGSSERAANTAPDTRSAPRDTASADSELPRTQFAPPSPAELATHQAALVDQLAAGRKAITAGDPAAAVLALDRAAAIDPMNPELRAELGLARLGANQLELAERELGLGLHHATTAQTRAALLDALGRVSEARGDKNAAAEFYARALTLQPGSPARERLARLTNGVETIGHRRCEWRAHGPAPAQLCQAYVSERQPIDPGGQGPRCADAIDELSLDATHAVAVFSYLDPAHALEVFVVNAIIDGRWYSAPLASVHHPAVGYADEVLTPIGLRLDQLAPGGLDEVVLEWSRVGRALDPATALERSWTRRSLALFSVQKSTPRWMLALEVERQATSAGATELESVALEWLRDTGELVVSQTDHPPSAPTGKFALGAYPGLCAAELGGF